jgi:hypothetical protein
MMPGSSDPHAKKAVTGNRAFRMAERARNPADGAIFLIFMGICALVD